MPCKLAFNTGQGMTRAPNESKSIYLQLPPKPGKAILSAAERLPALI